MQPGLPDGTECTKQRNAQFAHFSALLCHTLQFMDNSFLRLAVFLTRSDTSLFNRVVSSSTYLRLQYARVVILRTPPYWSVRVASCLILNLVGNSFHCRSRTASDMTCKLGITFVDESKDFYVEKSGQSSCRRAKRSWLVDVRREKPVSTRRKLLIEDFATSVYKQPKTYCTKTTTVSSGNIHYAHPRAVIPSFGSNRGHATRK